MRGIIVLDTNVMSARRVIAVLRYLAAHVRKYTIINNGRHINHYDDSSLSICYHLNSVSGAAEIRRYILRS